MTKCECAPGTEENGWHEFRCEACIAVEREAWGRMMDNFNINDFI